MFKTALLILFFFGMTVCQSFLESCNADSSCTEHGYCASSQCVCKNGFHGDGWTICSDIDECTNSSLNTCHMNATCINEQGTYHCECNRAFSGDGIHCMYYLLGSIVTSPNEDCSVLKDTTCDQYANCTKIAEATFACECIAGSTGDGLRGSNHTGCLFENLPCLEDPSCHHPNGMCDNITRICWCNKGYYGDGRYDCTDVNECTQDVCDPNAKCENTPGSFICSCFEGYIGNGLECTYYCNVDSDCHSSGRCVNGLCSCRDGFLGDGIVKCEDIDECNKPTLNDCSVHALCTNTQGSYTCQCNNGFSGNGKDCIELPQTCHQIFLDTGSLHDGKYFIDPDGIAPLGAIEVTCKLKDGVGVTVMHTVDQYPMVVESGLNEVLYEQSYDHVQAVIDNSVFCSQSVSYSCLSGGKLVEKNLFYWLDGSNSPQYNWGGGRDGQCLCGQLNKCHHPESACNCDGNSGSTSDAGKIFDKDLLPLKAVYNGNNQVGDEWSVGEVTCGPRTFDFPRDCDEARFAYGLTEDQPVMIDVDGPDGPVFPTVVFCNMSYDENVGITEIPHSMKEMLELESTDPISLNYAVDDDTIQSLISGSSFCSQDVYYTCKNSALMSNGREVQWYDGKNDVKNYFPGALGHENKCACGVTGTCEHEDVMCNCDIKDGVTRSDFGTVIDKNDLPITKMKFSDVGNDQYANVSIGSLKCSQKQFGIQTNCERILHTGFKQDYSYIIDPDGPPPRNVFQPNNVDPYLVNCDMDESQPHGVTVIHHDQENPISLSSEHTSVNLVYNEVTTDQIEALKSQSTFCEQKLHFRCGGLPIFDPSGYINVYWKNIEDYQKTYFSGVGRGNSGCQCSQKNECLQSGMKCNCDSRNVTVEDIGYIGNIHDLPLKEFGISHSGRIYLWDMEGKESTLGLSPGEKIGLELEIGPLKCYNIHRDCDGIYQAVRRLKQKFVNGIYTIDPDGSGGVSPFSVHCQHRQTRLKVNPPDRWKYLWAWRQRFHICYPINYELGASKEQVQALVENSKSCYQSMLYMCKNAPLIGYSYYSNCKGERQPGWAGGGGLDKCICGAVGACIGGTDKKCHCDNMDDFFHIDQSAIIDRELLPVCEVCLNVEPLTDDIRVRYAYFYVADLFCTRFHMSALNSCQKLRERQRDHKNTHLLSYMDPDGYYGEIPYPALCEMQKFPPVGILETRVETPLYIIPNVQSTVNISYHVNKMDNLLKSIDMSKSCEQEIVLDCYDAQLMVEEPFGLYDRNGEWIRFWAGNQDETSGCKNGVCNCNGTGWASDGGLIKDKALLPITAARFPASSGLRNLTVGHVKCYELYEDCEQIRQSGRTWNPFKNNTYAIDPDQGGGVDPFSVLCDFDSDSSIGITEVGFPSKDDNLLLDAMEFDSNNISIQYDSATPEQISALVHRSDFCYQSVEVECKQTALSNNNNEEQNYGFYSVTDDSSFTSFGSGLNTGSSTDCACSLVGSCPTEQNCLCDIKTNKTTVDLGVVMEKDSLPVNQISYWGDTLSDAHANFALSVLRCGPKPFDFPKDCEQALALGFSTGEVMIRPRSYTVPFFVYCDMEMVPGHGVTVIGNDLENPQNITSMTDTVDVTYNGATLHQVEDLTHISAYCFQPMRFKCFNTEFVGKQKFFWNGYYLKYRFDFAGGEVNSLQCQCGRQRKCGGYDGWWNMYRRQCNCDLATDQEWRIDAGIVNGTGDLPIEKMTFENGGMSGLNSQGILNIGKLYCSQIDFDMDECEMGYHDCHELATCLNTFGSYTCECMIGFRGQGLTPEERKISWSNGRQCFDDNECRMGKCPWSADCLNFPGSFNCTCKDGFNQTGPVTCIDIDECQLALHNCDKNARCINTEGNFLCRCIAGYRGAGTIGECYGFGTCTSFGDPHYISYDGAWIHFQGQCRYILSQAEEPQFAIYAQNWDYNRGLSGVAWVKEVEVVIGETVIEMLQNNMVRVNGYNKVLPVVDNGVSIKRSSHHVSVFTDFGLQVTWDGHQIVKVRIPSALQNKTSGICANYDTNARNDMMIGPQISDSVGDLTDSFNLFGYSWIDRNYAAEHPECAEILETVECTKEERAVARGWCSVIFSAEYAQECIRMMPNEEVEEFIESCIFDTCHDMKNRYIDLCNIAEAFVGVCQEKYRIIIQNWRREYFCHFECGANQHYEDCGYLFQQTVCHNVTSGLLERIDECRQGCFCNDGFVLDNGECVTPENCSCVFEGNYYMVNQPFSVNECNELATCHPNNSIIITSARCHDNASCRLEDGVHGCHCNTGFFGDGYQNCTYNPCLSDPCVDKAECIVEGEDYICKCLPGYYADCEACYDIDECETNKHECDSRAKCVNTEGSYKCLCPHGYIAVEDFCIDVDECTDDLLNGCGNNTKCINKVGEYDCICCDGYALNDKNECSESGVKSGDPERKCCVCDHVSCDDPSPVCGEDGITYPSYKDLVMAECRTGSSIGMDYKGPCTNECSAGLSCPSRYQKCMNNEVTGQAECDCMPCNEQTFVQTITEEVCSTSYILYTSICTFIEGQCRLSMNEEIVVNNNIQLCMDSQEDPNDTLAEEWETWSSCSVTCGQGTKQRTREVSPSIRDDLKPLFPETVTAECFEAPCESGACGNITCTKPGAVCVDKGDEGAACICRDCNHQGDDFICALIGNGKPITYQNPCTVERNSCLLNEPFEILNTGYCGEEPVRCSKMPDIKQDMEYLDQNCTFIYPLNLGRCSGGCGDTASELCCQPVGRETKSVEMHCPDIPQAVFHDFDVITDCQCKEANLIT